MKKAVKSFAEGDLVFAKVRGYPAWPARISSAVDTKGQRFNVFFYGTYETAVCKKEEMWQFNEETKAKYGKQKRKGFVEALLEIESNPEIALEISTRALEEEADESGDASDGEETADKDKEGGALSDSSSPIPSPVKTKKRANKRKAEDSPAQPPPSKQAKTTNESAKKSRSGRVIKEKKLFVEESPIKSPPESPRTGQRKMWVCVKGTGDLIEINLDKDRPITFDSKESEIQWERASAINALKLKEKIDSGHFLPEELRRKIETKVAMTPQEEELLLKEKKATIKQDKLTWLKIEQRLVDLNIELQKNLHLENPDMSVALDLLDEFQNTSISALMFKKQPQILETIRKLRKYIGPSTPSPDPRETKEWVYLSEKIRLSADVVYTKIQAAFGLPEGVDFITHFTEALSEFKTSVQDLPKQKLTYLVSDPATKKVAA